MIGDFLLSIPAFILQAILSVLPNSTGVPVEFTNAVYTIWSDLNAFSFIVPVSTIATVLGLAIAYQLGKLVFKIINYLVNKIPFIGS